MSGFFSDSANVIAEGPMSTVTRVDDLAVKTATTRPEFSKEPHDITKEVRILSKLEHHDNIIAFMGSSFDETSQRISYTIPFIRVSLADILSLASSSSWSKPILHQTTTGLAFLHGKGIAHRDVKAHNILITDDGCVKLIDFGIVWTEDGGDEQDLWPETKGAMYCEVSTGPYRAPELLFGPKTYNPFAIDIWSLGVVFAEFFTTLRFLPTNYDEDDTFSDGDEDEDEDKGESASSPRFVYPAGVQEPTTETRWTRDTLFDSSRGEIGLAWSIFKIRGTPDDTSWPTFKALPYATKVEFMVVPRVPLSRFLPHLMEEEGEEGLVLDLLEKMLVYEPDERIGAVDILNHAWFAGYGKEKGKRDIGQVVRRV